MTDATVMESWRKVWRDGFAPLLSEAALTALRDALRADDPKLLQGSTTTPPPLMCVQDWPVEAGCVFGYCGAVENGGFGTATVGQAEEFFTHKCHQADNRLGETAGCRWFLNWWDETPRPAAIRELLPEVDRELAHRGAAA